MSQIHVLQLIDGLNVGGAEVLLRDLVSGLQGERYRVSVGYSTPGPLADEIAALGVPLTHMPRVARVDLTLLSRMVRLMHLDPPHVVHTHLFKSDFHGRVAARICNIPAIVSTLHNVDAWASNPLLARLYGGTARFADRLIAVSDEVRRFAIERTAVPEAKVLTIDNGVSIQRFDNQQAAGAALRQELGIAPDAPLLGVVGRLAPQKDHATFLVAAQQILAVHPTARFLIVGHGDLRGTLEEQATSLGMAKAVVFAGLRKDVPAVMAAIDLLVFSSRWEGLPVALLEGMAARCAVVATAVGGVPGVVVDGTTGLLVPPADPAALAQACLRLLADRQMIARMGQAGRARVEARYSIDSMVRQTAEVYEQILTRRGLGQPLSQAVR